MKHYVYFLRNETNGKIYVGVSNNPERRWRNERSAAFNLTDPEYGNPLSRAIRRDGWGCFTKHVLEEWASRAEALEAERFWIDFLRTNRTVHGPGQGYNLSPGGDHPPSHLGKKRSEETLARMRASNVGKNLGKRHTVEAKARISAGLLGRQVSQDTREKIRKSNTGIKRSEQTLSKMRASRVGLKVSEQARERMRNAQQLRRAREMRGGEIT